MNIHRMELEGYISDIFSAYGVPPEDSRIVARVLVAADARGIPSHGVARLGRYVRGIEKGSMLPLSTPRILHETGNSLVLDAQGALGPPVSENTMGWVLRRAEQEGMAFASVRDSNHFGIAGYYAMEALPRDMIGICLTNTAALGVPTFGRDVMFGTNPIAVAVPAERELPFVLDMSTTVVTRGKIEVYQREGKTLPAGWAVNKRGLSERDPGTLLRGMLERLGGGILPLGGEGELFGGFKGYGLAVLVDIFTALLSGAPSGPEIADTKETSARVSHFFGAIKIDRFRPPQDFKRDMDTLLFRLRSGRPAEGHDRVYYAGLKEALAEQKAAEEGVNLPDGVWATVTSYGDAKNIRRPR